MSRMYVANCSQQDQTFLYRLPESPAQFIQDIRAGQQVPIAKELRGPDIDAIVEHHERYGMIHVDQVGRYKGIAPLIYSIDRSIPLAKIQEQVGRNTQALIARGEEHRRLAAVQSSEYVEKQIQSMKLPDALTAMDISVVEESRDERSDNSAPVAEGYRVSRGEAPSDPAPRPRRARRARAAA